MSHVQDISSHPGSSRKPMKVDFIKKKNLSIFQIKLKFKGCDLILNSVHVFT